MGVVSIVGGGTYTSPMIELARACGYEVRQVLSQTSTVDDVLGVPVRSSWSIRDIPKSDVVVVAVGSGEARLHQLTRLENAGYRVPALVHPLAYVSPSARIGNAVYIHQFASIWSEVVLERGVLISPHASVAHHSMIGKGSLVSTGAAVGASCSVGKECSLGIGSIVITGVRHLADRTTLGAGAVVVRDILQPGGTYVGVPARAK